MSRTEAVPAPVAPAAPKRRRRASRRGGSRGILLLVGLRYGALPVVFMAATALKDQSQYLENQYDLPVAAHFGELLRALRGGTFFTWFKNSVILTVGSVSSARSARRSPPSRSRGCASAGRDVFLSVNIALMVVPPVVMLIPLFILFVDLHLVSTYQGVILIYAGLTIPFSIYLLTNFFRAIPRELIESALTDGASHLRILLQIILPLSVPALVTLVVVNALWVWNELLIALVFLPEDELKTLMVGITVFRSRYNLDVPMTMAGMLLASLPWSLLYLFGQRFFIRGLTAGAVKG